MRNPDQGVPVPQGAFGEDRALRAGRLSFMTNPDYLGFPGAGEPSMAASLANPSAEYAAARAALLEEERRLRDRAEEVAALRRRLPPGPKVGGYVFREGPRDLERNAPEDHFGTSLADLFEDPGKPLILMHFMYAPGDGGPCPMCAVWADGYNAVIGHIARRANFAVVAKAPIGAFRARARERGWTGLRLLSSGGTTFNADFGMETAAGAQIPGVSVLVRGPGGAVRLFHSKTAMFGDGEYRGMDLLSPVWNYFDLLPEGRGDWLPAGA